MLPPAIGGKDTGKTATLLIIMTPQLDCDLFLFKILGMLLLIKMNSNLSVKLLFSCLLSSFKMYGFGIATFLIGF